MLLLNGFLCGTVSIASRNKSIPNCLILLSCISNVPSWSESTIPNQLGHTKAPPSRLLPFFLNSTIHCFVAVAHFWFQSSRKEVLESLLSAFSFHLVSARERAHARKQIQFPSQFRKCCFVVHLGTVCRRMSFCSVFLRCEGMGGHGVGAPTGKAAET